MMRSSLVPLMIEGTLVEVWCPKGTMVEVKRMCFSRVCLSMVRDLFSSGMTTPEPTFYPMLSLAAPRME